jgi:hypothetical protein
LDSTQEQPAATQKRHGYGWWYVRCLIGWCIIYAINSFRVNVDGQVTALVVDLAFGAVTAALMALPTAGMFYLLFSVGKPK